METDRNRQNSLNLYSRFTAKKRNGVSMDAKRVMHLLAETIADELVNDKASPLLDAAVFAIDSSEQKLIGRIHRFSNFNLDLRGIVGKVFPGDGTLILKYLANYISNGQIRRNEIYDPWYEAFGTGLLSFVTGTERTVNMLQMIDRYLPDFITRTKAEKIIPITETKETETKEENSRYDTVSTAHDPTDLEPMALRSTIMNEAKAAADRIISEAKEKAERIIQEAQEKADRLIKEADEIYEARMNEADRRLEQFRSAEARQLYKDGHDEIVSSFAEIRRLLNETGMNLNELDQKMNHSMIRKIFRQYYDLYSLIHDVADHVSDENPTAARVIRNHQIYMDLIMENLEENGIMHFVTAPGEHFDPRKHEVRNNDSFDPKTAAVTRSLRNGFMYGDTVLQKELVELEGGQ